MPKEQEKPKLEWIEEPKKDQDNSHINPIYYRDDMDFLRDGGAKEKSGSVLSRLFNQKHTFVVLGCLCTTGFLLNGLRNFFNNNPSRSQLMMRGRVIAQGLTVMALCAGALKEANERMSSTPPTPPEPTPTPSPSST